MDNSQKLNNCDTCELINDEFGGYSSESEDFTSCSESLGKETTNTDSLLLDFDGSQSGSVKRSCRQQAVRQNKTFSADKLREIERRNAMLVERILYHNRRPSRYKCTNFNSPKVTSSEINRRRHHEKISRENEILLKKIQSVKPAVRYA